MTYTWQYYDLVLGGIVVSMFLGVSIGYFTAISLTMAVIGAALVAVAIIGHGLFVNGPVDEPADLTKEVETLN